jgi:hypothetical protein
LRGRGERVEYDERILGWGDFVARILGEADKDVRRQLRVGERERLVAQAISRICEESGVREEEVRSGGRRKGVSRARAEISYYLSHELGVPAAEIARHLGVCSSAIVKAIQRIESRKEK